MKRLGERESAENNGKTGWKAEHANAINKWIFVFYFNNILREQQQKVGADNGGLVLVAKNSNFLFSLFLFMAKAN